MVGDARLLGEISRSEYELWGNPFLFERMINRVRLDPAVRVMFLTPEGQLLYSSEPNDANFVGEFIAPDGLELAQAGGEVVLSNYSGLRLNDIFIDVFSPVVSADGPVVGLVRVTYRITSILELLSQTRFLIVTVIGGGLFLGGLLGLVLALNINRYVQRVTHAIYDVAHGNRNTPLLEEGPEELQAQARAVNYLVDRLQSLEQSRRQLLANLVHELGRPLGALRSAIHALSTGAAQDPKLLADLTEGMDQETARLKRVLEELAQLHDQVLGTLELQREAVPLSIWLPSTLLPWQSVAEQKNVTWQQEIPTDLPIVQADSLRLAQIIGNLADNAVKYTPAGHSITVSAGEHDGLVWVRFHDTGLGIAASEQARVFTPFFRGDQGRRFKQGMGLGLSIAHDLAQAHGGRIDLSSETGKGSEFTLWLPILPP
jgi:signal transduction histidine kinase